MTNIIKVVSVIVFLFGAFHQTTSSSKTCANVSTCFTGAVSRECDDEPIVVRGHVRTLAGSPIDGASVKLKQGGVVMYQTTTNSSGAYYMDAVTSGNYVLHLSADGYITKTVDLSITSEVVRVDTLIAK